MVDLCEDMRKFGRGIGNTSRYRIIEALFAGSQTVGEIVKKTKLSQPLVSQHLRVLKETELVEDERQGQEVYYKLNAEHTVRLLKRLSESLQSKKRRT
ncbi:MAG: transcriptional regulator [Candidatus Lloydbacteria bacterium CG22_combo_CG10-13_8_21_14_all_47_15]|uniref:Transcriptional regulator n=1 Tax=Candidatus Lloydbacteria bacterium CG22_combo_CG10-13_8_21_14_all_47_15 TaxID=1974635 RepID=A0A2H0CVN9_9BACT|nr:MAG: transcriptional regulator [Candidatus Lloydbacteria bacterium CG22_combo_CG10-13_8_21_14_all_47_15]